MDAKDAAEDEASVTRLRTKDDSSGGGFCDEEEEEKERRRRVVGSSSSKQKGDVNDAINVESRFGEGVSSLSSKGNGALTTAKRKGKDEGEYEDDEERREIMPYRPTYGVGKEEGELLGKKEDLEEEDQEEEKFASMEEKFTNEEWWDSTTMRDENAGEFIVNIEGDDEETKLSPEEVVYEEDEDWFNRPVDEDSITGIRLPVVVQNVSYKVKHRTKKNEMIKLLNEVSVVFQPCRVTALMGPSGAGKTTLLDVIAGRKTQGTLEGKIFVGEKKSSSKVLKSCAAYVEQFDNLLPTLTVRETLLYAAELKRPNVKDKSQAALAAEQRVKDVDKLLDTLQLRSCEHTVVGSNLERGISGGQAKRVNIGISLVTKPRILFLDEPTSGLDSETSCGIVKACRDLADGGVNVIATIHSPSAAAFQLFDNLVMMKRGSVTYAGALFGANGAEAYFYDMGFYCEPTLNFADFLVSTNATDEEDFVAKFKTSMHAKHNRDLVQSSVNKAVSFKKPTSSSKASKGGGGRKTLPPSTAPSSGKDEEKEEEAEEEEEEEGEYIEGVPDHKPINSFDAAKTLLKYRAWCNYRDKNFMGARVVGHVVFSIVMASMYWKQGDESAYSTNAAQNVANLLFMNNVLPAFASAAYMPSILMERGLFYRELDDGCYTVWSYGLYKTIEEVLVAIPVAMLSQLIVHYGCGLQGNFFYDWMVYFAVGQCGAALAYVVASASKNIDVANAALPVYNVLQILFSGLLMREQQISKGWEWWPPTLFVRYGWKAQMLNHFNGVFKKSSSSSSSSSSSATGVFYDEFGVKSLSATEFYDAEGTVSLNLLIVAFICAWWMVFAGAVMSTVRHQNR